MWGEEGCQEVEATTLPQTRVVMGIKPKQRILEKSNIQSRASEENS